MNFFIILILSFIIFWCYTTVLENNYENILKQYGNKTVKIQAIIESEENKEEYKDVYKIKVTHIEILNINNQSTSKETYNVNNKKLYEENNEDNVKEINNSSNIKNANFKLLCNIKKSKTTFKYGDKVQIIANYEIPEIARNEGGFNYREYLKTKQVSGIVTVKSSEITKIAENKANWLQTQIYYLKNNIIQKIKSILPENTAGICIALVLGNKSGISEEIKESFKQSSLSHMLAISGAHVSYILAGITVVINKLKMHKRWSKIFIIIFLIFFIILIDFTPSVTRACIMCILQLLADILFLKSDVKQNLAISSLIILAINPYSVLDIGFQLSFGGTLGIIIFMNTQEVNKISSKTNSVILQRINKLLPISKQLLESIKQIIKVSLCANIIIFPIMLYHFNTLSLTFLISNLLASSVFGICLIMSFIFIIITIIYKPIAIIFSYLLNLVLNIFIVITNFASKLPFSQILLPTPNLFQILIYYILIYVLMKKENIIFQNIISTSVIKKNIIVLIFLLIFPYFVNNIPSNYTKINVIDVGQR